MTQENSWTFFGSLDVGDVFTINQTPGKFIKIKDTFLKFDEPEGAEDEMPNAFHIDFENYCWISATIICHRVESPKPYRRPKKRRGGTRMSTNLFDQYDINVVLKVIHALEANINKLSELQADDVTMLVSRSYVRGLKAGYKDALSIIKDAFYITEPHKSEYVPYNEQGKLEE